MTFQAYRDNIQAKTGQRPDDFRRLATEKGFLKGGTLVDGTKAGDVLTWLKTDFDLGHGHAMAIYTIFKGKSK